MTLSFKIKKFPEYYVTDQLVLIKVIYLLVAGILETTQVDINGNIRIKYEHNII